MPPKFAPIQGEPRPPRRYRPDPITFETQQEFLDALTPISVASIAKNDCKCAYCWRPYGESNPGFNDAEEPVRLRCNHVFGEQCMRQLFAVRQPTRTDIIPLSFAPGSRGADLGSRLSAYVESHGVERSALLTGGKREKDFTRLLNESLGGGPLPRRSSRGIQLLGEDWYGVFLEAILSRFAFQLDKLHILENTIIFDIDPNSLSPAENDLPIADSPVHMVKSILDQQLIHATSAAGSSVFGSASSTEADSEEFTSGTGLSGLSETLLHGDPPLLHDQPSANGHSFMPMSDFASPVPKPSELTWEQEANKLKAMQEKLVPMSGTWKDAIPENSTLDKLVAQKKKQIQQALEKSKITAAKTAQKKQQTQEVHQAIKMANGDLGSLTELEFFSSKEKLNFEQKETHEQDTPLSNEKAMEFKALKEATGFLAPTQAITSHIATQGPHSTLGQASTNPYPYSQTPSADLLEATRNREVRVKEAQMKRHKTFTALLARALTEVYEAYEQYQFDDAVGAGCPPPIKKLKLADSSTTASPPEPIDPHVVSITRPDVVHFSVMLHKGKLNEKSIEVDEPVTYSGEPDDSTEEDGAEPDEDHALVDKFIFLQRVACSHCAKSAAAVTFVTIPEYIFWKNSHKVSDNCPKCRRILFLKGSKDT